MGGGLAYTGLGVSFKVLQFSLSSVGKSDTLSLHNYRYIRIYVRTYHVVHVRTIQHSKSYNSELHAVP